jgi:hypothetical protein
MLLFPQKTKPKDLALLALQGGEPIALRRRRNGSLFGSFPEEKKQKNLAIILN